MRQVVTSCVFLILFCIKDSSALLDLPLLCFITPNICAGVCQQEVRANLLASWWEVHISRLIVD